MFTFLFILVIILLLNAMTPKPAPKPAPWPQAPDQYSDNFVGPMTDAQSYDVSMYHMEQAMQASINAND